MNLFTRTFAAFLLVAALVLAGLIVMSSALQSDPPLARWQRIPLTLRLCAAAASQQDARSLPLFLRRAGEETRLELTLPGERDPDTMELAEAARRSGDVVEDRLRLRAAVALRLTGGERRVLVARVPGAAWMNLAQPLLRGLFAIGVAAAVCYRLARSVSAPTLALRGAAHRVARGDFSVRVAGERGFLRRRDELGELARDFDAMVGRLDGGREAQRRLLTDISHELRSPLARLGVALELARRKVGPESAESLERIEREAERMNRLIAELLGLARLESEKLPLEALPVDLIALVDEIARDADFEAGARGCRVEVLPSAESFTVSGERELLRRAVENVVRNALRHTDPGTSVEIGLERVGGEARLRVRDRGPGVPADALPHLFEPFWRVGADRDRASGGFGVGLALADRAVRLHGGRIGAENRTDGRGLAVTLALPAVS